MQAKLDIWSEERNQLFKRCCIYAVSHQRFSIAKSSNRCLTALTYGCRVLSMGLACIQIFQS